MTYTVVGLGNPDEEYKNTRHNVGAFFVEEMHDEFDFSDWKTEKKRGHRSSKGEVEGVEMKLIIPTEYMNNSGKSLRDVIKTKKAAERLIVVHDDLDLPLGKIKVLFGRGSGGNRGVESIFKHIKTKDFFRIKVGIAKKGRGGVAKKVGRGDDVKDYVLGTFRKAERETLEELFDDVVDKILDIADGAIPVPKK